MHVIVVPHSCKGKTYEENFNGAESGNDGNGGINLPNARITSWSRH